MVNPWWEGPLVGLRLETTGSDVDTARIVTAEVVRHDPTTGEVKVRHLLVDPGAAGVDGLAAEAHLCGMPARAGVAEVLRLLAATAHLPLVVCHGARDLTVLDREARRHGLEVFEPVVVVDPMVLDKHLDPCRRDEPTLRATAARYGVRPDADGAARPADQGAVAWIRLARAMGRTGRLLADARELHERQVRWRFEQAVVAQYVAARGCREGDVPRQWPVIELPTPARVPATA